MWWQRETNADISLNAFIAGKQETLLHSSCQMKELS